MEEKDWGSEAAIPAEDGLSKQKNVKCPKLNQKLKFILKPGVHEILLVTLR